MTAIRVGVLRGGVSNEYDVSLKTGGNVLNVLPKNKYKGIDVLMEKDGTIVVNGITSKFSDLSKHVDVVFNALHGEFGEDGRVQQLLESTGIPYTGSSAMPSSLGMNKVISKEFAERAGMNVPKHILIKREEVSDIPEFSLGLFKSISQPRIIKPIFGGSSVGMTFASNLEKLKEGIEEGFKHEDVIMLEEHILGKEVTCGVIDNFRGQKSYALPVVEIQPPKENSFFDYDAKYSGKSREICPSYLPAELKKKIEEMAVLIHEQLGLRHYSRSDFIIGRNKVYFIEVNTLPGLTEESLLPKSLEVIGLNMPDFVDHVIRLALLK
ncbi:MAG: D-alanine-D-alanine ligase [Parcubacteria group bacterium LiPW_30]|nr:MAG: D-alanine-D-alanine ligase [Parcubacteria group bacterium LiPW_30]